MVKIEKKIIENKPFFYVSEQINVGDKFKKIQVYLGKNIPKNIGPYFEKLKKKEYELIKEKLSKIYKLSSGINIEEYFKTEKARIELKYFLLKKNKRELDNIWKKIAIDFIFHSNAIEGSKLSEDEVKRIVEKKYIKNSVSRREIIEVENSIKAFEIIRSKSFKLNQRSIIDLHKTLVKGLDIQTGYKKVDIVVNNKKTTAPGKVKKELSKLLLIWNKNKKNDLYPFVLLSDFHAGFESIHPFEDGNGRVGRLIFNWMLIKNNYGPILIENSNRQSYFSSLNQADKGRPKKLYRFCMKSYKKTIKKIISR